MTIIILCTLFSGTIKTLATAKVQIISAEQGKIEERITLEGQLVFPYTDEIIVTGMDSDIELIIQKIYVEEGRWVSRGEKLFSATVKNYEKLYNSYLDEYISAQSIALELERKYSSSRLTRAEQMWIDAYDQVILAGNTVAKAKSDLEVYTELNSILLPYNNTSGKQDDETLTNLLYEYSRALEQETIAQENFKHISSLGVNEDTIQYIISHRNAVARMEEAHGKIIKLRILNQQVETVYASHAGYIVSVFVDINKPYNGQSAAILMSDETSGAVIRANTSGINRKIDNGTKLKIANGSTQIDLEVCSQGINADGSWYIEAPINYEQITFLGGAAKMMNSPITMTCSYRSQVAMTLLPISAVRGSGENKYVYLITEQYNLMGNSVLKVSKKDIHVILTTEDTVAIEEDLGRSRIAYMEDRQITEGTEVMPYEL